MKLKHFLIDSMACELGGWERTLMLFCLKIPWLKTKRETFHHHDATVRSFVAKVCAHFHAVTVNVTVVCEIDCSACQDMFFVNSPLDVKEIMSMILSLLLTGVTFFTLNEFWPFPWERLFALSKCHNCKSKSHHQ
jgi:hypothetical protein